VRLLRFCVLQISSTGRLGSAGSSPRRRDNWLIGSSCAPAATPVACSSLSRMSTNRAWPVSCRRRASSSDTTSAGPGGSAQAPNGHKAASSRAARRVGEEEGPAERREIMEYQFRLI
jgi:hypothetical protein